MTDVTGKASSEQQVMALVATELNQNLLPALTSAIQTLQNIGGAPAGLALLQQLQAAVTQDLVDQITAAAGVATEMAGQTS